MFVAAGSIAALLCLQAAAQSAAAPAQAPAQTQPAAPAQQPVPPLQLHDLPPDPHTPTPAEAEAHRQQRILAAATRMASEQAHWGPDISTPGISISMVEVGRTKTPQGTQIDWHLTGSGFTPGERLNLIRWPLNSPSAPVMGGLEFDAKGTVVCAAASPAAPASGSAPPASPAPPCTKTMQPGQPLQIEATAAPGEAIRVALIGEDRKHGAATSVTPFPIVNQDKGCRLEVLLGMRDADMVLVKGSGFPPNASLSLDAISDGDTHALNTRTNADGNLVVLVLPGVKGHPAGETTVRFGGINHPPSLQASSAPAPPAADCSPAVTFNWGAGSYKPE